MRQTATNSTPRLRFPEFTGAWEEKRLGDVVTKCLRKNQNLEERRVLTNSASEGVIEQKQFFDKNIATEENINSYYLSENGDFIYNPRISKFAPVGPINRNEIGSGLFSPLYVVFRFKNADTDFFKQFFKSSIWHDYILSVANYGVRHDRINITNAALMAMPLHSPHPDEQKKIAGFLGAVDRRIAGLEDRKAALTRYKKGLMQQLFAQTLRFTKPNNTPYPDWEEKRLGDLLNYEQPTKYLVSDDDYDDKFDIPVLTAGKSFLLGYTNEKVGIYQSPMPVIIFDDFTTASKFVDFPFKAKSSAMKLLHLKHPQHSLKVIFELLNRLDFPIGDHKRYWISEFQNETIILPHPEEQKQIAAFLSAIDRQITALTNQITTTKAFKKALLQQMFV